MMEHEDSKGISEDQIKEILLAGRNAAIHHHLQPADADACSIDFGAHMSVPERFEDWRVKSFSTKWLNACADNIAKNYQRGVAGVRVHECGDGTAQAVAAALASQEPGPERKALSSELRHELDAALSKLPETDREMLIMRAAEKRSYPEIAAVFSTTPDAARMTVKRALAIVRSHLEHSGFDPDEGMRIVELPPPANVTQRPHK